MIEVLYVEYDSADDRPNSFDILKEVRSDKKFDWSEMYYGLCHFDPRDEFSSQVYFILSQYVLLYRNDTSLMQSLLLYQVLDDRIQDEQPEKIVCDSSVSVEFGLVVKDLADQYDIPTEVTNQPSALFDVRRLIATILGMMPFFLDQVVSWIVRPFVLIPERTRTVFTPLPGRLKSMKLIFADADFDFEVLVTPLTLTWLLKDPVEKIQEYDPIPINLFCSPGLLVTEIGFLADLAKELLVHRNLSKQIHRRVERSYDIRIPRAIRYNIAKSLDAPAVRKVFSGMVVSKAMDELAAKQLVIGDGGPAGHAMVYYSSTDDIETYHLPHSVTTKYFANKRIRLNSNEFAPGPLRQTHLEHQLPGIDHDNVIEVGRPYLTALYEKKGGNADRSLERPLRVLLATQPYRDSIRARFARSTIDALEETDAAGEIVVKLHPSESREFYEHVLDHKDQISIREGNLWEELAVSDIVITISSNVGLEGIIAGTVTLCHNEWHPIKQPYPYFEYGPIPQFRSDDKFWEFLDEMDIETLNDLAGRQREFVFENYIPSDDAVANIIDELSA